MTGRIALAHGGWTAEVAPAMGGAILSLALDGTPVLRPTPAAAVEAGEVRASACYPLVPYANRIALGRFAFGGADYALAPNFAGSPHTLHGVGWLRPWRVEAADATSCALSLDHRPAGNDATAWPFAFRALQRLSLGAEGLTVTLSATNTDTRPAPAGLGLHPFFPRRAGERLRLVAGGGWLNGPDMLPAERVAGGHFDFAAGRPVGEAALDNDLFGWDGAARMTAPGGLSVGLAASAAFKGVRVYVPDGRDFFAVEPVTHRADAIHHPDEADGAMTVLAPGESLQGEVQFLAEREP